MSIENEVKKLTAVVQQLTDAIVRHNLLLAGEDAAVLTPKEPEPKPEQKAAPAPKVEPAPAATSADLLKRRGRNKSKAGAPTGLPFEVNHG